MEAPPIAWVHDWDDALRHARASDKLVLIHVGKDD